MTPEEIQAQIQQWEQARDGLRDEDAQVQAVQPTGFHRMNPRGVRDFQGQIQRRRAAIMADFNLVKQRLEALYREREKVAKAASPKEPKPMTEAQELKRMDIDEKKQSDVETEQQQEKLAKSKLEQEKAAEEGSRGKLGATTIGPKGAVSHSLKDLMTKFGMRYNQDTGDYDFEQDNTEGNLTAEQKRKAKELENTMKVYGYAPEELFGPGVPAPSFNSSNNAVPGSGNPFSGSKAQFESWKSTYERSQPRDKIGFSVPAGVLSDTFEKYAPGYGGALGENPVRADAKRLSQPAADIMGAQAGGRVAAISRELGRPATLSVRPDAPVAPPLLGAPVTPETGATTPSLDTPITLGTGGVTGVEPRAKGASILGGIAPQRGLQIGTAEPGPSAAEKEAAAAKILADREAAEQKLTDLSIATRAPRQEIATIFSNTEDPVVQKRALDEARSQYSSNSFLGDAAAALGPWFQYGTAQGWQTIPGKILSKTNEYTEQMRKDLELQRKAREARGLPPLDEEPPRVDFMPGS